MKKPEKNNRRDSESTDKLLRVILALLLRRKEQETLSLREQIEILDSLGLRPSEIALILARTDSYVNKELSGIRKARKKGK